ncbi:MAG: hypothetical protein CM15mP93_11220 [Thiotrichaceae bacterium]|nr:MAG: hypothetical protein CM15mP93_11220 [Thiotrichaceae bacterium]
MTIAAYNVGLGHLEDARKLTQRFGGILITGVM